MTVVVRSRAGRGPRRSRLSGPTALLVAGACAAVLVLTGCGRAQGTAAAAPAHPGLPYTLMQMNLCLSGRAGCYARVDYPAGIEAAVVWIRHLRPDAATFNEACGGDVALIARRTGYHPHFSRVIYQGRPLPCIRPGGRGPFGDAILTRARIDSTATAPFVAQAGPEQRRWLCVATRVRTRAAFEVCTAHLASRDPGEAAANAPQCAELRAVLARRASAGTVIFGGDVNRLSSCAPRGFWGRTDASAHQDPGSQQVYGTGALRSPSVRVQPAGHTDHDVLLVHADLAPR